MDVETFENATSVVRALKKNCGKNNSFKNLRMHVDEAKVSEWIAGKMLNLTGLNSSYGSHHHCSVNNSDLLSCSTMHHFTSNHSE